ncbi:MAG: RluA family pseudouridine synthase [Burkholderiales bacterium]|nr:RluA family pseudouridine synthase [Burkholderiales bacterium]
MTTILSKNCVNFHLVNENDENQRLDNLLKRLLKDVPKAHIYRIIRNGEVRINKKRCEVNHKVQLGELIRIPPITTTPKATAPQMAPKAHFPIIYEDDYYLVINKPDGVACHGGSGISFGVIEQLRQTYNKLKFLELAHRLDRDTSGILILAKKRRALVELQELIRNGQVKKNYWALTHGIWKDSIRNIKAPLFKYLTPDGERRVRVDRDNGQFAHTIFSVVQNYANYTLVNADLKTGRTHQIRVHLQYIGYPIVGDNKYGDFEHNRLLIKNGFKRMFLHAHRVEFIHPITQVKLELEAKLPSNLQVFLNYSISGEN